MQDIPEDDLAETRAALAPMLKAAAAVLPWVDKPPNRFDAKLNQRWVDGCKRLHKAWLRRHEPGKSDIRPAIFNLYAIALQTRDADCLGLGEALADAADKLEVAAPSPKLAAALSGAAECFNDPAGLEHEAFGERARHFAERLLAAVKSNDANERSVVIDRLFVEETLERIERMRDALVALPPDVYAIVTDLRQLVQEAEHMELWGVMHLSRQLVASVEQQANEMDQPAAQQEIGARIDTLTEMIRQIC